MSINYTSRDGARIKWVVPGPGAAFPASTDTFLNVAAGDPFGTGPAGNLNLPVHRARYGIPPVNEAGTEGVFPVYAEAIGTLSRALAIAAANPGNDWGLSVGPSLRGEGVGFATDRELNDFAATECPQGRKSAIFNALGEGGGGSGTTPGQPAILSALSPGPGLVDVAWRTRAGHSSFDVRIAAVGKDSVHRGVLVTNPTATGFSTLVELPAGFGGEVEVTVKAYIGGTAGVPSMPRTVIVEPGNTPPVVVPPVLPPAVPPTPPPTPTVPPVEPPVPTPTVNKLSPYSLETVVRMVKWYDPVKQATRHDRMDKLAGELRELGLVP